MSDICIGLFGTCGGSNWRNAFMEEYTSLGIQYFNPQKEGWKPEDAAVEAQHLVDDDIILFPITGETYGMGSLSETGFSIMQAIKSTKQRYIVVYIDTKLDENLEDSPMYKESVRARALVLAHLRQLKDPRVFLVKSMEDMLRISLNLHNVVQVHQQIRSSCL